jgi:hypothetical protein
MHCFTIIVYKMNNQSLYSFMYNTIKFWPFPAFQPLDNIKEGHYKNQ